MRFRVRVISSIHRSGIFVSSALSEAVASTQERVSVYRRRVATLYLFKRFRPIPTQQNVLSDS